LEYFVEEAQDVPVEASRQLHWIVGEAVNLVEGDDIGPDVADDHSPARRA
jgi:hypothetical protein